MLKKSEDMSKKLSIDLLSSDESNYLSDWQELSHNSSQIKCISSQLEGRKT